MKQGWEVKKLGEVCIIERGSSPRPIKKFVTDDVNGINWIKIGDTKEGEKYIYSTKEKITIEGSLKSRIVNEGDFILSNSMSFGRPYIMKIKGCIHDGWFVLRLNENIDSDYFYNLLSSNLIQEQFTRLASGAIVKNISSDLVKKALLPIPPLQEQQRIVSILDKAFADIDKLKENTEKNLKNAREVFESYLQSVFENKGEDWEERKLGEILEKTETIAPTKNPNDEFIYIDVSSVNKDTKEIESVTVLIGKNAPSRARKLIKTNDVIFATVRPTHRRVAIITEKYNNQVCSTGYFILRAKKNIYNNLIYYFLLTETFNKQMEILQKGASYPAVTDSEVKSQYISFPKSIEKQKEIVKKLDELQAETKRLEEIYQQKLNSLEELKQAILHKAFNGEL